MQKYITAQKIEMKTITEASSYPPVSAAKISGAAGIIFQNLYKTYSQKHNLAMSVML
jgi:hypothetical protein